MLAGLDFLPSPQIFVLSANSRTVLLRINSLLANRKLTGRICLAKSKFTQDNTVFEKTDRNGAFFFLVWRVQQVQEDEDNQHLAQSPIICLCSLTHQNNNSNNYVELRNFYISKMHFSIEVCILLQMNFQVNSGVTLCNLNKMTSLFSFDFQAVLYLIKAT